MSASIAKTSAAAYRSGWNLWCRLSQNWKMSPIPPASHDELSLRLAAVGSLPVGVQQAIAFCAHTALIMNLSPGTICGYLAGVAFHLKMRNQDVAFLSSDPVSMAKAGLRRMQVAGHTHRRNTAPFTLDMILRYADFAATHPGSVIMQGILLGQVLAFTNLLRKSEYIPTKAKHFLRATDVTFILTDTSIVISSQLRQAMWDSVTDVVLLIRSSKTDQGKEGFRFVYSRRVCHVFNICELCMSWAVKANLQPLDPFLSARDREGFRI